MRTKKILLILVILIISNITYAQITFQKTYGGTANDDARSVQQTTDEGFIIVGYTASFSKGMDDLYLIKTDAIGDTLWTKSYGGQYEDVGYYVQQTNDGGYIITGSHFTNHIDSSNNIYMLKTNAIGAILWEKTYRGGYYDGGAIVQQTTDGGYIMMGNTVINLNKVSPHMEAYLIKTDSIGDTLWAKTYGGLDFDYGSSIQQTPDGGYVIAGTTKSFGAGDYDVYLFKIDSVGDILWSKSYGGVYDDGSSSVQQTTDGGYIIAGSTNNFGAEDYDVYIIKTNAIGDTLWTKIYGGQYYDNGYYVQQTTDGGYVIAGITKSFGAGSEDVYLIKTDSHGVLLWSKTFGGTNYERSYSVQQTADSGYIITGSTNSFGAGGNDVYIVKTDANGNSGCNQGNTATITGTTATAVTTPTTIVNKATTKILNLNTLVGKGGNVNTLCFSTGINEVKTENTFTIYPNPATNTITIDGITNDATASVYDISGKLLIEKELTAHQLDINILNKGLYFIKLTSTQGSVVKKFVKE